MFYLIQVTVSDDDYGTNGKVNVTLITPDTPFKLEYTQGTGTVTIKAKDAMNETFSKAYNLFINATDQAAQAKDQR